MVPALRDLREELSHLGSELPAGLDWTEFKARSQERPILTSRGNRSRVRPGKRSAARGLSKKDAFHESH